MPASIVTFVSSGCGTAVRACARARAHPDLPDRLTPHGGFGFTAAMYDEMVVVPIRTGVGARLGVNVGYLKFTPEPTWNPF